jgi:DNA damage-binding protein 1
MAYVDDGVVFVGSMFGDSQLVKIAPERAADGGCLSMLSTEQNIGPVVDFCLVDSEQHGYSHFVSCSGAFKVLFGADFIIFRSRGHDSPLRTRL